MPVYQENTKTLQAHIYATCVLTDTNSLRMDNPPAYYANPDMNHSTNALIVFRVSLEPLSALD